MDKHRATHRNHPHQDTAPFHSQHDVGETFSFIFSRIKFLFAIIFWRLLYIK